MITLLAVAILAQSPLSIVYPAGAYTVTTPGPTIVSYTSTSVTLSWAAAPVPPVPVPPVPTPTLVPVLTGHVWALAIYDPNVVLPIAQQVAALKAAAMLQDVDFQVFPCNDASVAGWLPQLPKSGLPALLFVQKSASGRGELAYAAALPVNEADILSIVNKVRGK